MVPCGPLLITGTTQKNGHCSFVLLHLFLATPLFFSVGQNHICTVYIRYFWQGNHQIYGHIRCVIYALFMYGSGQPYSSSLTDQSQQRRSDKTYYLYNTKERLLFFCFAPPFPCHSALLLSPICHSNNDGVTR